MDVGRVRIGRLDRQYYFLLFIFIFELLIIRKENFLLGLNIENLNFLGIRVLFLELVGDDFGGLSIYFVVLVMKKGLVVVI